MQGGSIDGAEVAATHSRPLSLASPPPPFIKKESGPKLMAYLPS